MNKALIFLSLFLLFTNDSLGQIDTLALKVDTLRILETRNDIEYLKKVDSTFYTSTIADTISQDKIKTNALIRAADAFVHTAISPVRWNSKQWLTAGAAIGGAAVLTLVDQPIKDFIYNDHGDVANSLSDFGFHNGKPYAAMITTGGFYLTGLIIDDEWTKETAVILGSAYLTSGALQTLMKKVVGRARPLAGYGEYEFRPFNGSPEFSSFPSGHTQIALVTSMVLAERVDQVWLKALFYSGAAITMTSRMYDGAHWFSDVTFGAFISYYCTKAVMNRLERNKYDNPLKRKEDKHKISWQISPNFNGIGVVGIF